MELEHRVEELERELEILKETMRETLLAIQKSLPEKPASPSRWQKKAWMLALLNTLLAITLFTNIRFYTSDTPPFGIGSLLSPWLQAFWVALAFLWLLLQMYPLALLLDQEDGRARKVTWRNSVALFRSNPGLTLALTSLVLILATISALFPSLWFVVMVALFAGVCANAAGQLVQSCRQRAQIRGKGK